MSDFNCFLVQLTPFRTQSKDCPVNHRDNPNVVKPFQEMSIEKGLCGMGYSGEDVFKGVSGNLSEFIKKINGRSGLGKAVNEYRKIKPGDYVFTRLKFSSDCYVGKVTQEAYMSEEVDEYSWTVKCNWKRIGIHSQLPNAIRGLMGKRLPTIELINEKYEIGNNLIRDLYEGFVNRYPIDEGNFNKALAPYDLEDLVEIYIEKENPGFRLYSSTCKPSEPEIEFVLTNGEEQVTCQVKNMKSIDINHYRQLANSFNKIYLFSGIDKYDNNEKTPKNVIIIPRDKLFSALIDDYENHGHFFKLIDKYYKLER